MFNEANAVEEFLRSRMTDIGWTYVYGPTLNRTTNDAMVETSLRAALIRLNPEVTAEPDRADEVIYKLRGVILGVAGDGLVRSNEEYGVGAWRAHNAVWSERRARFYSVDQL